MIIIIKEIMNKIKDNSKIILDQGGLNHTNNIM